MRSATCARRRCATCAHRDSGLRQINPHVLASLRMPSLHRYRKTLGVFLSFLFFYGVNPVNAEKFDDLLTEWKLDTFPSS